MSHYYFTIASLPHLTYDMENLPSIDNFLEICEENISKDDFNLIRSAVINDLEKDRVKNSILSSWYNWERNLRNKLVELRAKKKKEDPEKYKKSNPELLIDDRAVREAFEHESPLTAEDILNWDRWSYLEELELGHYFDTGKLLIYYLKLQLLWRKESFNKEKGTNNFNEIIEKISTEDFSHDEESIA